MIVRYRDIALWKKDRERERKQKVKERNTRTQNTRLI